MGANILTQNTLNKECLTGLSISSNNNNQSHSKSPGIMKGNSYGNYAANNYDNEIQEGSAVSNLAGGRSGKNTKQIRGTVNNNYIQIEALQAQI